MPVPDRSIPAGAAVRDGDTWPRSTPDTWLKGAAGEQIVAERLAALPATHWRVLHDLPIGGHGANVDHLVLGPPGVFTINTKFLRGRVDVSVDEVRRSGRRTDYLLKAVREAERVATVLATALGEPVRVHPLLVIVGAEVRRTGHPVAVTVLQDVQLVTWLGSLAQQVTFETWQRTCRTATAPQTWRTAVSPGFHDPHASNPSSRPGRKSGHATGSRSSGSQIDPHRTDPHQTDQHQTSSAVRAPAGVPTSVVVEGQTLELKRWRRFGHDRLYVHHDAIQLGYVDLRDQSLHPTDGDSQLLLGAARAWSSATGDRDLVPWSDAARRSR